MTTINDPSQRRSTRVAQPRSVVIRQDGLLSTYTPRSAAPNRTVTTGPPGSATLPFAASFPIPAALVVTAMATVVLLASAVAVLTVYAGNPDRWRILTGFVVAIALWCAVLAIPATARLLRLQHPGETARPSGMTAGNAAEQHRHPRFDTDDQTAMPTRTTTLADGNGDDVDHGQARDGRRSETRRAEAVGGSGAASRKAVGADEVGVEDRRPLGNGETSFPQLPEVSGWR